MFVQLQPARGFVPLLVVGLLFVNVWAGVLVGRARKHYGVDYPQVRLEAHNAIGRRFVACRSKARVL